MMAFRVRVSRLKPGPVTRGLDFESVETAVISAAVKRPKQMQSSMQSRLKPR